MKMSDERPLNRRSFLTRIAGAGALSAAIGGSALSLVGGEAEAITDRDPYDPVGRGRRCTDRDPGDPVGRGRWCRGRRRYGRRYTGYSDNDPGDPVGYGYRRRRITDNDPDDPVGRGRG